MIINKIEEFCINLFQINHLLKISPINHILLKTFNSEFQTIELSFADQNS